MSPTTTVLQGLSLCNFCQKRLGLKLGSKYENKGECYICGQIMTLVKPISEEIVAKLKDYEFETFLIGASVPHTVLNNEDELRSRFKIKGRDSIKSQITKLLSQNVKRQTGKIVNYSKPDLTILASMADRLIDINVRSVWLSGRYVKLKRGLPQRSSECATCSGLGCAECAYKGRTTDSVQGRITDFLSGTFEAEGCNFVWLGSEDENSLVRGSGRPFYVEVVKPKRRFALKEKFRRQIGTMKKKSIFFKSKEITILDLVQLEHRVTHVPQFEITARIYLYKKPSALSIERSQLNSLEQTFPNELVTVRLSRKFRTIQKEIRSISFKELEDENSIELTINCDGGIPLKKFISGQDNIVRPNLGSYLSSYEIAREKPFDILNVKVKETFGINSTRFRAIHESALNENECTD